MWRELLGHIEHWFGCPLKSRFDIEKYLNLTHINNIPCVITKTPAAASEGELKIFGIFLTKIVSYSFVILDENKHQNLPDDKEIRKGVDPGSQAAKKQDNKRENQTMVAHGGRNESVIISTIFKDLLVRNPTAAQQWLQSAKAYEYNPKI